MKMRKIKEFFGYCSFDGCMRRKCGKRTVIATLNDGRKITCSISLCEKHAREVDKFFKAYKGNKNEKGEGENEK